VTRHVPNFLTQDARGPKGAQPVTSMITRIVWPLEENHDTEMG
jgi:hypothetical protein